MTNREAISNLKDIKEIIYEVFPMTEEDKELSLDFAIKALEKIDDVKNHKFLSPDNPDYFDKLPEITKGYQKGWNDALDAVMNDFRYEEEYTEEEEGEEDKDEQLLLFSKD